MTARLIRLMPTGEVVQTPGGIVQCMEPVAVEPLHEERITDLWRQHPGAVAFARALEAEHGIGRRLDA